MITVCMSQRNGVSRRNVLKKTGLLIAGTTGLASTAAATNERSSDEFQAIVEAGQQILRKKGPEARQQFFKKHGLASTYEKHQYGLPSSAGGVSTQDLDCVEPENCNNNPDLELSIGLVYDSFNNEYFATLDSRYRYSYYHSVVTGSYHFDGPENPLDGFGFFWEKDHWRLRNRTTPYDSMSAPNHGSWDNGSWINGKDGTAFKVDDRQICIDSGVTEDTPAEEPWSDPSEGQEGWSNWDTGGVYLVRGSNWQRGDTINAEYIYTYGQTTTDFDLTISYPLGLSIDRETTIQKEDIATNPDGKALVVTESDAIDCC